MSSLQVETDIVTSLGPESVFHFEYNGEEIRFITLERPDVRMGYLMKMGAGNQYLPGFGYGLLLARSYESRQTSRFIQFIDFLKKGGKTNLLFLAPSTFWDAMLLTTTHPRWSYYREAVRLQRMVETGRVE